MTHSRHTLRLLSAALLVVGAVSAQADPHTISIAEARSLPLGTEVTVDGSVTTPSGAFYSSFFDNGFGLQDRTAGIFISSQVDLNVAPRRQARVTGTLANVSGLLVLVLSDPSSDVKLHGAGPKIEPKWVTTAGVSEATEGLIVRIVGTIIQPPTSDFPYGDKFTVDDGSGEAQIFVNYQTGIDLSGLVAGQTVSVTGFSSQFDTHYEIDPRSPADIESPAP
jgi:hypothetical protein